MDKVSQHINTLVRVKGLVTGDWRGGLVEHHTISSIQPTSNCIKRRNESQHDEILVSKIHGDETREVDAIVPSVLVFERVARSE